MAKCRPKLSNVSASDLITVGSFQWSHGHKIGEGSYGKVYLGWSKGNTEQADIAVKYIKKEHLTDKKVNENMQREINILKGLSDCPNVVRLWESLMRNGDMILFMELCDYDLDHYVKQSPFNQRDVKLFLSHMAKGLKVLQERGIVHRDLKPQNILVAVDPVTEKKQLKIADFGFARHFIEEGIKQSLHSMAGTPVFMAPEALRSVMTNCKTKYDAKVDLWSVGAVLYKCLVGHCGFYATLQEILVILENKGDAIAFERKKNPYDPVKYYYELPVEVKDRLSDDFAAQITNLLKSLLKVNAHQRLDFAEFFTRVDALTKNNIQVVDALSVSTVRMSMSQVSSTSELVAAVGRALSLPHDKLVLFSEDCQWVATPWEVAGVKDVLSRLNPQHAVEANDPVVYAVTLDVNGDSDAAANLSIVYEIGSLLSKLSQLSSRKGTEPVNRLMSSSAAGGLGNIQRRQLKAQRVFWSLLLHSYSCSSKQLRATEREILQSFGSSISSIETLRQYLSLSRSLGCNTQSLEAGLVQLDTEASQISKTLSVFTDNMDVLAVDSAKDITCEHQDFEIEMRTLRMDVTAVGSVELSQLQTAAKKAQDRLKDLVCRVHASLAGGYKHGMVMLQRLSETQSAASPLQAQAHRVAKQVEALLTDTYDLLSSSVKEVSDPMVVIEVAKHQEQGATGSASPNDQVCAACDEKQAIITKLSLESAALKEKAGKDMTNGQNMEDTLRTSVVEASQVSDSESTLQEVTQQLRGVLQDLSPSLSVPPLEDPPHESMESYVVCGSGEGSKMPIVLELKNLVGQLKDVTLGTSLAESMNIPSDEDMLIKVTPNLQPGDLVLFMQTRDPTIYCALLYTDKVRIFMDKESLERHEKDMKQSSIPGTPFVLARVGAVPRKRKTGHSSTAYGVTSMYSVKCTPVSVAGASSE